MKVLVIGSEGTLGKPLCRELERRGIRVYRADLMHKNHADYMRCDISSYRQCERLFEQKFDYVYLLAAEFGRINGEHYYDTLWNTNVVGTRNIIELQKIYEFKLIFTSSSEIYGEVDEPILHEDLPNKVPLHQHNDYAITKWVNELQCMNAGVQSGSQIMRIRLFNAYGPGEEYSRYRSVVCLFCYSALLGLPYNVYQGYKRVFMYIDDLIPTLANACIAFAPGEVYNIGGTEYKSVEQLHNVIVGALRPEERRDDLMTLLPQDAHNVKCKRPDIGKAINDLGHDPVVTLETGIPRTIKWMREFYNLPAFL